MKRISLDLLGADVEVTRKTRDTTGRRTVFGRLSSVAMGDGKTPVLLIDDDNGGVERHYTVPVDDVVRIEKVPS